MKFRLLPAVLALCAALTLPAAALEDTGYPDVAPDFWAANFITQATQLGYLSGMEDGTFSPDTPVTYAQFSVMVARQFDGDSVPNHITTPWWFLYVSRCLTQGYLEGSALGSTTWTDAFVNSPCPRQEMAVIMVNALAAHGIAPTQEQLDQARSQIADLDTIPASHQTAVCSAYALGILSGMGDGTFQGSASMTRAQAAVVLCAAQPLLS